MFNVTLIDGDIEFSMKAFRTLKGAKNFANKLMEQTSEWGAVSFGKVLFEDQHMVLVRWEQDGSVEEMTHADFEREGSK